MICFLAARSHGEHVLSGYDQNLIEEKCRRAGLLSSQYEFRSLSNFDPQKPYRMLVPLDGQPTEFLTGKKSIWKWHLSPLDTLPEFRCRRAVPTFHPDQVKKEWHLNLYLEMAVRRAAAHAHELPWERKRECYLLDPNHDLTVHILEGLIAKPPEWLSIDIETGRNQINTFGVAWSPNDAIAIKVLPDNLPANIHYKIWSLIHRLCESDTPKVMQNGIYERMYLSRYGIHVRNFRHDTMCAMKFLYPELEKGLDNVGRIYTMEPYWKDDGRVESEEGKQKDWGNIRNWDRHFDYNCKDSSNTLIACLNQRADLKARGLADLYDGYIQKLFDPTYEMCARGLPLNKETQARLIAKYEARSAELVKGLSQQINPRSPKAKLKLLKDQGLKIPQKRDKVKGGYKDSSDELTLKKMRLTYPENGDIQRLLEIAGIEKALSSYLRVRTLDDSRIRFSIDPCSTETGRMSAGLDPWGNGFNAQTMTSYVKQMIEWAPDSGRVFVEVDLRQAETRFVAYDACETTLLGMLERGDDIHKYVAAEIYQKPMADVTHDERQLGKKSGHGANYSMGVATFQDSCMKEMDLVLDRKMAARVLEAYHKLFPAIREWHRRIRNTVYNERRLVNPLGRVRYFYGRTDDNTYREAYAYRPQSTVPDIANHLMLRLNDQSIPGLHFHLQCHDSILISCPEVRVAEIVAYVKKLSNWHPKIILSAGELLIPVEVKSGRCLGRLNAL